MNAVEFFKKYGAIDSKKSIERSPQDGVCTIYTSGYGFERCNRDDLKKIVEAWGLVESYGGLSEAKELHYDEFRSDTTYNKLQKSINLVEQFQ